MSFDKFLLGVESPDLSQTDKSIVRVSSFSIFTKLHFLTNEIYSYTGCLTLKCAIVGLSEG